MNHAVPLEERPRGRTLRSPAGGGDPAATGGPARTGLVTVFLADGHELVQLGVRCLLEGSGDLTLVGTTADPEVARRAVLERWADLVLIDAGLDGDGGRRLSRELAGADGAARYCFLVEVAEPASVAELSRNGASGFLHKRSSAQHVLEALRRLPHEGLVVDPLMAEVLVAGLLDPQPRLPMAELSERELELLRLLGEGRTNREIADVVFLSEKTVKNYLSRLFRKLGVRSRTEAALLSARYHPAPVAPGDEG